MMRCFLICTLLFCFAAAPAQAELKYYPDPAYKKLNDEDSHPMDEMLNLAKQGDVRAQFILGDLYSKGKGGLAKDLKEARRWFEESAMHGYNSSFVRLAALAKHADKPIEAWQWYTLAIDGFDYSPEQKFIIKARHDLVEAAKLSPADITEGRKLMSAWKDLRNKQLQLEKEAARQESAEERKAAKEKMATTGQGTQQQEKKNEQN